MHASKSKFSRPDTFPCLTPSLCGAVNRCSHRAVLFLDPHGMQVEWKTIEAIAATGKPGRPGTLPGFADFPNQERAEFALNILFSLVEKGLQYE